MARQQEQGPPGRLFRKRREQRRYEQAAEQAREHLSKVMAHQEQELHGEDRITAQREWATRKRENIIDLSTLEEQFR